jgi:hypothetical protein
MSCMNKNVITKKKNLTKQIEWPTIVFWCVCVSMCLLDIDSVVYGVDSKQVSWPGHL